MKNTRHLIPAARRDDLVVQDVENETLVYDLKSHKAHCLNPTAALVWKLCDGKRNVEEVVRCFEKRAGTPVSVELVLMAVNQLEKSRLLEARVERAQAAPRISRRELARRLGMATALVALPLVTSINAPAALQGASCIPAGSFGCVTDGDCCPPARCNTGTGQCFNP